SDDARHERLGVPRRGREDSVAPEDPDRGADGRRVRGGPRGGGRAAQAARSRAADRGRREPREVGIEMRALASLEQWVGAQMAVKELLPLAIRLAGEVAELHGHGALHEDLRPATILFD